MGPWFAHKYITYFTALSLPEIMDLPLTGARPNPGFHDERFPIGPDHVDLYKGACREARRLDPFSSYDYVDKRRCDHHYMCMQRIPRVQNMRDRVRGETLPARNKGKAA